MSEEIEKAMSLFADSLDIEWEGTLEGSYLKEDFVSALTELRNTAYAKGREKGIEECVEKIQADCSVCGGTGAIGSSEHFVSHEMALDAGDPSLEGQSMGVECQRCEYCGRPIEAIRQLKGAKP